MTKKDSDTGIDQIDRQYLEVIGKPVEQIHVTSF